MGYLLEIVAALVASYLLTPAAAFQWLTSRSAAAPQAALQQRSSALARATGRSAATFRSAASGTCPDCDLCADPFCGCGSCGGDGLTKRTRMACGCESGCPGGCGGVSGPGAFAAHALGCSCDDC